MRFLILLFAMTTASAHAFEIQRRSERLVLSDASCDKAADLASDLQKWSKQSGRRSSCHALPQRGVFRCEVEVTDCVPEHVKKYEGTNPALSGPNCFNLALVMKGILPIARYSSAEEIGFYMRPPLCRSLKNGEKREAGDIGLIYQSGDKKMPPQSHAFIYISDEIAYSKNGYHKKNPYSLEMLESVYKEYGVPKKEECRQNYSSFSKECKNALIFFRCDSMSEYLKAHPEIPSVLKKSLSRIESFEECLETFAVRGHVLTASMRASVLDASKALVEYLQNEKSELKKMDSEEREFILGALQLRLDGIADQLDYSVREKKFSEEMRALSDVIWKANQELAAQK